MLALPLFACRTLLRDQHPASSICPTIVQGALGNVLPRSKRSHDMQSIAPTRARFLGHRRERRQELGLALSDAVELLLDEQRSSGQEKHGKSGNRHPSMKGSQSIAAPNRRHQEQPEFPARSNGKDLSSTPRGGTVGQDRLIRFPAPCPGKGVAATAYLESPAIEWRDKRAWEDPTARLRPRQGERDRQTGWPMSVNTPSPAAPRDGIMPRDRWLAEQLPPVDRNALVLTITGNPVSFVLPPFPGDQSMSKSTIRSLGRGARQGSATWRPTRFAITIGRSTR
jgi:hypothetical protein